MDFPFRHKPPAEIGPLHSPLPAPVDPDDADDDGAGKMSFLEHLDELRKRLTVSAAALGVGFVIAFLVIDRIFAFIMRPLYQMMQTVAPGAKLVYIEPTEAFMLYVKIALLAGVVLAAPVITWQLWLFVAPGLYLREKRFAIPFIVMASIFFVMGAAFSHYFVFPWAWVFLASFSNDYMTFQPRIEAAFSLYAMMLLAMGIIFEMPAVVFLLARMGLATPGFLWRNLKYAVLIIFVVAAVITPTGDMMTQTLMAAPMFGLYLISIIIAWVFGKKKAPSPAAEE
jgi:sec-independent protein translocase protein TatC